MSWSQEAKFCYGQDTARLSGGARMQICNLGHRSAGPCLYWFLAEDCFVTGQGLDAVPKDSHGDSISQAKGFQRLMGVWCKIGRHMAFCSNPNLFFLCFSWLGMPWARFLRPEKVLARNIVFPRIAAEMCICMSYQCEIAVSAGLCKKRAGILRILTAIARLCF